MRKESNGHPELRLTALLPRLKSRVSILSEFMKYLVSFMADGIVGNCFLTLDTVDAYTTEGFFYIVEQIKKDGHYENVVLLNIIQLKR